MGRLYKTFVNIRDKRKKEKERKEKKMIKNRQIIKNDYLFPA
jgi:hypothetical protein